MKLSKIKIDSTYGIEHLELDGKSVEFVGKKGTGKTSVLDAVKLALTNKSDRKWIIKNGEKEAQIFVQTDNGIEINRKKRSEGSDYNKVTQHGKEVGKAQSFINEIFTPLQLNPVEFSTWSEQEQNRAILNLIKFNWDLNWIKEQFGELPKGINYEQHILEVLSDIQDKKGFYWQEREQCNRDEYYKRQAVAEMAQKLPTGYDVKHWKGYDLASKTESLHRQNKANDDIRRAKVFLENHESKLRGLEADKEIKISARKEAMSVEEMSISKTIEQLKKEIEIATQKLGQLNIDFENEKKVIEAEHQASVAKLEADMGMARDYADKEIVDTAELQAEINEAIKMKEFVSEYSTMQRMEQERKELKERSEYFDGQIKKARMLPGEILQNCELPIADLEVKDGVPLVKGLPVSNLSGGELIDLCVDVTLAGENNLEIILLNGVEALDDESRTELYNRCKAKGLQIIAARTTNDAEFSIVEL